MEELIVAQATAPQAAAIGILRLSGEGAVEAVETVFRGISGRTLGENRPGALCYGTLVDSEGVVIDQVLATYSKAPHSYTGEDTAEIHCHGAPLVLAMGLDSICKAGARLAKAGEFTQRAFLNGKLDLPQAEAVADLLDAQTSVAVHTAAHQLGGGLSRRVEAVYDNLVDLMAHFHAVLDYPDEDIDDFTRPELTAALTKGVADLTQLVESYHRGKYLAGGVPCALVGAPNAGKSSLLNALLGYDRAIVTPIPGTTRDTVEERCTLGGVLLRLIDTAGLRDSDDVVEQMGVARSRQAMADAGLVMLLLDPTVPFDEAFLQLLRQVEGCEKSLLVLTRADLGAPQFVPATTLPILNVSGLTGQGIDQLGQWVAEQFPQGATNGDAILTNLRQVQWAEQAKVALEAAQNGLELGITPDAVLTDVEGAMEALAELMGRTIREDVVARVFSRFCVGK